MNSLKLSRFSTPVLLLCLSLAAVIAVAFKPAGLAFIELQKRPYVLTSKEFYIATVIDDRVDKNAIGTLVQTASAGPVVTVKTNVKGGSEAIRNYIAGSLPATASLRPLVVKLKTLTINETFNANGMTQGSIKLSLQFGLMHDDEFIKLDEYDAQSTYQRKTGVAQQAEPLLANAIANSLIYINKWLELQADNNIALAKGVQVTFTDHKEMPEGDTVYYDINRPLKWADFKDSPRGMRYGAEVFASLGYNENVKLIKGIIHIKLDLKVYLPKSACWARPEAMTDYGLAHEQHHFDIVKLVAEHFKQSIQATKLDTYNYDGPINVAYFEALREIDRLQKQYDGDTEHSQNTWQQQQWNNRIDKQLQQLGVKPISAQAAFK